MQPDGGVIEVVVGRIDDYLVCKDGGRIQRLDFIFKGVNNVKYAQLVQEKNGFLNVNVVPDKGFSEADEKQVETNVIERIGKDNIDFKINLIEETQLRYTKRGKFKYLIHLDNITVVGVILRVIGRVDDYIVCKDGSRVTRVDFVEDGEHIKACQWIQHHEGELEVRIVPDEGFTEKDKQFVTDATLERCGRGNILLTATVCTMDDLEYTSRGKFRLIVNKNLNHITH